MKRYEGWHHLTLRGDRDAAQRLVPLGRKLLGAIAEEMERMGTAQGKRVQRTPDGAVIVAQIIGAIPTLTITAPAPTGAGRVTEIEGFVVRPSPEGDQDANLDPNHVLLLGAHYKPSFFDAAHIPEDLPAGTYGTTWPDGFAYGNVDWRNDAKAMQVNWLGPNGRYFGATEGAYGGPLVWCKGRILFDTREPYAADLGIFETAVQGACLRGALWLYVVVRTNTVETLVRFRVRSQRDVARARALGLPEIEEHRFVDLVLAPDSGEVLASHAIPTNNGVHPWFFNASGTQAKRIDCTNGAAGNTEWTLEEDPDTKEWAFSSIVHTSGRTISTVLHREEELPGGQIAVNATTDSGGAGYTGTNAYGNQSLVYNFAVGIGSWQYQNSWTTSPMTAGTVWQFVPSRLVGNTGSNVRTDTRTQAQLPAIVDYRDDEVVYGYGTVGHETISYSRTLADFTSAGTYTGSATDPAGAAVDYTIDLTFDETQVFAVTDSSLRRDGGLTCDFLDVQAYASGSNTGTETLIQSDWTSYAYAQDAGGNPTGPTSDGEFSYTLAQDLTNTAVQAQLELHFLDLRYRHAYLHTKTITTELVTTGSVLHNDTGETGTINQSNTQTTTTRALVIVNGAVAVDSAHSDVVSASGVIYDGSPRLNLNDISLSGLMGVTTAGATTGYTENAGNGYFKRTYDRSSGSSLTRGALVSGSAFQMREATDFPGSDLFTLGAIVSKGERFAYSLAGKDTPPPGEQPYYNALDNGDLGTQTGNQLDVVRYFPLSYLPRTVIVR